MGFYFYFFVGGATLIISKLTVNELFVKQDHNISMKNDFFILKNT